MIHRNADRQTNDSMRLTRTAFHKTKKSNKEQAE